MASFFDHDCGVLNNRACSTSYRSLCLIAAHKTSSPLIPTVKYYSLLLSSSLAILQLYTEEEMVLPRSLSLRKEKRKINNVDELYASLTSAHLTQSTSEDLCSQRVLFENVQIYICIWPHLSFRVRTGLTVLYFYD